MMRGRVRTGFTLVEMLITLAVMAVSLAVVVLAFRAPVTSLGDGEVAQALAARRVALREGRPVTIEVATESGVRTVTALPNAMIVADSGFPLNRIDVAEPPRRQ